MVRQNPPTLPPLGGPAASGGAKDTVRELLAGVTDPEIPVLTIEDLGILRSVEVDDRRVTVTITPTYSGCPAMSTIRSDIRSALGEGGFQDVQIKTVYAPAWTTEWMSPQARQKLQGIGIAPPGEEIICPNCGSAEVSTVSQFGSTACKALIICDSCAEPFDHFKAL